MREVKASYSAIITALDHIYSESNEPEALGIKKALCKKSTIAAISLLDNVLPQVAKLSIFDPRKVPATFFPLLTLYGKGTIGTLIDHYAQDFQAESVHGVQFVKDGIISPDVRTEWKTPYRLKTLTYL